METLLINVSFIQIARSACRTNTQTFLRYITTWILTYANTKTFPFSITTKSQEYNAYFSPDVRTYNYVSFPSGLTRYEESAECMRVLGAAAFWWSLCNMWRAQEGLAGNYLLNVRGERKRWTSNSGGQGQRCSREEFTWMREDEGQEEHNKI